MAINELLRRILKVMTLVAILAGIYFLVMVLAFQTNPTSLSSNIIAQITQGAGVLLLFIVSLAIGWLLVEKKQV